MNEIMRWVAGTLRTFVRSGARVVIAVLLGVAVVGLWPSILGGPVTYVIVSGDSMLPTMHHGDLVLARHRSSYEVGDIIVYEIGDGSVGAGAKVIHRIIGGSAGEGFLTQGDNREARDVWTPGRDQIAGSSWVHAPLVGRVLLVLRSPFIFAALAAGLVVTAVLLREEDAPAGPLVERRPNARWHARSDHRSTLRAPDSWCSMSTTSTRVASPPVSGAWPRDGPSARSSSSPDHSYDQEGGPRAALLMSADHPQSAHPRRARFLRADSSAAHRPTNRDRPCRGPVPSAVATQV